MNSSLKGPGELFAFPPRYWPEAATLTNYLDAVRQTRLAALYLNSLWVASATCLALMVLIVFSGYAMARFRFRGKAWLIALFLLAQVLPHVVLLLPFFTMFRTVGLLNTRLALVAGLHRHHAPVLGPDDARILRGHSGGAGRGGHGRRV